jgi:peptide deformylase
MGAMPHHTDITGVDPNAYELTPADHRRFAEELRLGLVPPQDSLLGQAAEPVQAVTSFATQKIVEQLLITAQGQREGGHASKRKGRGMVGLAAPQVGQLLRIIIVDIEVGANRKSLGRLQCFINPEIVWRSRETEEGREGCFSTGMVWGIVRRPAAVKIRAYTPEGKQVEHIFEGFTARIIQHEIDHLDGIRFPDRITSDKKRHWVHADELETYVQHYRHWPRICSKQRWLALRAG